MRTTLVLVLAVIGCGDSTQPGGGGGGGDGSNGGGGSGSGGTPPLIETGPTDIGPGYVPAGSVDAPNLTVVAETATSVSLEVCAGATGLPGGFVIEWTPSAAGWPSAVAPCSATFATPAFELAPNACTIVTIGRLFDLAAAQYTCDELACATEYLFHGYGLPTATLDCSQTSPDVCATTLACVVPQGCTLTQGYWKNHTAWPTSSVLLGAILYAEADVLAIFDTPSRGNGLVTLAHQLAAARLNIAAGADPAAVASDLTAADTLIGDRMVPPLGDGYLAPAATGDLVEALADYNEGRTGPGECSAP